MDFSSNPKPPSLTDVAAHNGKTFNINNYDVNVYFIV